MLHPDGTTRFSQEQAHAWLQGAILRRSIFLTGGAGVGKTHVTHHIVETMLEREKVCGNDELQSSIAVVAPTGAAARVASTSKLLACTVHRLFNIRSVKRAIGSDPVTLDCSADKTDEHAFLDEGDTEKDCLDEDVDDTEPGCLPTVVMDKHTRGVLCALRTLIIDEVSMLDSDMLGMIDCALRRANGCSISFGGVQIIAVGDFYQLSPVNKKSDQIKWAFTSPLWRTLTPMLLTKVHRQKDARFAMFLNRVRNGSATAGDVSWFRLRARSSGTAPLTIMPFNKRCDKVNAAALCQIPGPVITLEPRRFCEEIWPHVDGGAFRVPDDAYPHTPIYSKKCTSESVKTGCRVRVTRNVYGGTYPDRAILAANGQRGTLIRVDTDLVVVDLDAVTPGDPAERVELKRVAYRRVQRFRSTSGNKVRTVSLQFPITNASAITTHSSQGGSVHTRVDLDLNPCLYNTAAGLWLPVKASVYVALSRATAVENIRALGCGLELKNIAVYPEVKTYYQSIGA